MLNFVKDTLLLICAILIGIRELNKYKWEKEDHQATEGATHYGVRNKVGRSEFGLHLNRLGDCKIATAQNFVKIEGIYFVDFINDEL